MIKYFIWCWTLLSAISWSNISFGVERHFQLYRGQIFYLVLNATFSYIVVKYFIWCWTPLSVISWSNIVFGVECYFQLYRGGGNYRPNAKSLTKMRCLDGHYLILCISYLENWSCLLYKEEFENTKGVIKIEGQQHTHTTKDSTLQYRVWAPQGHHIKVQSMIPTGTAH